MPATVDMKNFKQEYNSFIVFFTSVCIFFRLFNTIQYLHTCAISSPFNRICIHTNQTVTSKHRKQSIIQLLTGVTSEVHKFPAASTDCVIPRASSGHQDSTHRNPLKEKTNR